MIGNTFVDNSDVNLICGSCPNATITGNSISHANGASFAALMLDNFNGATDGNFCGATVASNTIACNGKCHYGVMLGPHCWYASPAIVGGTITSNSVSGAGININIDIATDIAVFGNTPSGAIAQTGLCGKQIGPFDMNIVAGSQVDRRGDTTPVSNVALGSCP